MRPSFTDAMWTVTLNVLTILLAGLISALLAALALLPSIAHAAECPNEAFRTGPSTNLPDCRAYEMVTPVKKNGAYINEGSFISSPEGESVGFTSNSGFAGATSDLYTSTGYQATRGAGGWVTAAQTPSEARYVDHHILGKTDYPDESFGAALESGSRPLESGVRLYLLQEFGQSEADLDFYRTAADGVNVEVGPAVPPTASGLPKEESEEGDLIATLGFSADGSHVVFEDPEPTGANQWPFAQAGSLLEYAGTGNSTPLLVGVDDQDQFVNGCPVQFLGGLQPKAGESFSRIQNPISTDGSKIFFTEDSNDAEYPQCRGALYARVDNGQPDAHTVSISAPTPAECGACVTNPGEPAFSRFFGASEDGSKVFFYTGEPLLEGSGGLYEYDFDAPEGAKITKIAAGFFGKTAVLSTSQEGSHIYFFSRNVLTEEPSPSVQGKNKEGDAVPAGAVAQAGEENLYVFERDTRYPSGHIAFVATLEGSDEPGSVTSDPTPDGRFLVLDVHTPLTSDDLGNASQIFEYDAQAQAIKRISIGQDGFDDNGLALLSYPGSPYTEDSSNEDGAYSDSNDAVIANQGTLNSKTETESAYHPSAYADHLSVSADGSYVFFTSPLALTPHALDRALVGFARPVGPLQAEFANNVYEYHEGNVSLISDGQDVSSHTHFSQVHLLTTDLSGRDVFFETTDQLVPQDTDSDKDIYDARVDGGFAAPAAPAECSGDACQGQLGGAPVLLSPGSESQAGGDQLAPAPATKPSVKPKALTAAQKLAVALKACRAKQGKKRGACERAARKRYAPAKKAKKANDRNRGTK